MPCFAVTYQPYTRYEKYTVNALEGGQVGAFIIEIQDDRSNSLGVKRSCLLWRTNCCHELYLFIVWKKIDSFATDLPGCSSNQDLLFHGKSSFKKVVRPSGTSYYGAAQLPITLGFRQLG
jgi:hypothetical protein